MSSSHLFNEKSSNSRRAGLRRYCEVLNEWKFPHTAHSKTKNIKFQLWKVDYNDNVSVNIIGDVDDGEIRMTTISLNSKIHYIIILGTEAGVGWWSSNSPAFLQRAKSEVRKKKLKI